MSETNLDTALLVRGVLPLQQWLDKDTELLEAAKSRLFSSGDVVQYLQDVDHANDLRDKLNHLLSLVCGSTAVFFDHIEVDSGSLVVKDVVRTEVKEAVEAKEATTVKDLTVVAPAELDPIKSQVITDTVVDEPEPSDANDAVESDVAVVVTDSEPDNVPDDDVDYDDVDYDEASDESEPYDGVDAATDDELEDASHTDEESEDEYEKPMIASSDFDPEAAANKDDETADVLSAIESSSPLDALDNIGVNVSDIFSDGDLSSDADGEVDSESESETAFDVASIAGDALLPNDGESVAAADFSEGVLGGPGDSYQESDYDDDDNGEVVVDPTSF